MPYATPGAARMPLVNHWKESRGATAPLKYQWRHRPAGGTVRRMKDGGILLLSELLAATADAHSPRAIVRAIAMTLATRVSVQRVELRPPAPTAIAVLSRGEWRCV